MKKDNKILFLGDSITASAGASKYEMGYVFRFQELSHFTVFNYGMSGTRIANRLVPDYEPLFDEYFLKRVHKMEDEADYIVIFGGTNDFGHGDAPFGTENDRTINTFYGAINLLLDTINNKYVNKKIIVITPLHRLDEYDEYNERGVKHEIPLKQYVDAIIKSTKNHHNYVLNMYDEILNPFIRPDLFKDSIHPNDDGHFLLATKLFDFIKSIK